MKVSIVTIADTEDIAKALDLYTIMMLGKKVMSNFMTYRRTLLSGALVRQTDIFILELFSMDSLGRRAEGIFAAEKWLSIGKRSIIVSGEACADIIESPIYWDLAARDDLKSRIMTALSAPLARPSDLNILRMYFSKYYRRTKDDHLI